MWHHVPTFQQYAWRVVSLTMGWFTLGSRTKEMYPKLEWSTWSRAKFLIQGVYTSWVRGPRHEKMRWHYCATTFLPKFRRSHFKKILMMVWGSNLWSWVPILSPKVRFCIRVFWTRTMSYTLSESNISLSRDQQKSPRIRCRISATLVFIIFWTTTLMWTPWVQKFILKK